MKDAVSQACDLINMAKTHPDPVAAMKKLHKEAPPEDKGKFALLWSDLVRTMNEDPEPGTDTP